MQQTNGNQMHSSAYAGYGQGGNGMSNGYGSTQQAAYMSRESLAAANGYNGGSGGPYGPNYMSRPPIMGEFLKKFITFSTTLLSGCF